VSILGYGFTWPHYTRNLSLSKSCKTVAGRHAAKQNTTCIVCILSKDVVQQFNKNAELQLAYIFFRENCSCKLNHAHAVQSVSL